MFIFKYRGAPHGSGFGPGGSCVDRCSFTATGKKTFWRGFWKRQGCCAVKSWQSWVNTLRMVFLQNRLRVFRFVVARGQVWMTASTHGSSPRVRFADIAEWAMQRRFAGVNRGGHPRFPTRCFPGNHSGSASTRWNNCKIATFVGRPPPTFSTRAAIQESCERPLCNSWLTSRNASARACCHGHKLPGRPASHKASRSREVAMAGRERNVREKCESDSRAT